MISGPQIPASTAAPADGASTLPTSTKILPPGPDPNPDVGPPLIPVRMLNEFTYCPRLGYLEWVQGEWAENIETMQGTFGHRNVDKPDRKQFSSPESDKSQPATGPESDSPETLDPGPSTLDPARIHARSIMLSSEAEGLVAKLDIVEVDGAKATPVDYKRGQAPDIPEGAYEPERVQLCAQGLILRDNGFECTEGVIYFIASNRRVTIPFDDELVALTREQVARFRGTTVSGKCPPPLEDSPKCPRCSLVSICLPDETNYLRQLIAGEPAVDDLESPTPAHRVAGVSSRDGLRKLLPARQHALPFYVQTQGALIGKSGDRITVKLKGDELASVRLLDVSQMAVFGNVMFSAHAIKELTCRGIPICHFTFGGWFHSLTSGLVHKNVELRIRQYAIAAERSQSLPIARQFIAGKIRNCRTLLRRHLDAEHAPLLRQLAEYYKRALQATSAETLLGLEGMAAKEYFSGFFKLLSGPHGFDVSGRNRRPPKDPVNAVLSFLYSLLTKELTVILSSVGFDPMLGVFHTPRYGRPSLALDLAEEFRPLIADSVTLTVFNNAEVNRGSFLERAGAVSMTEAGRRSVIAAYERRLETEITHPLFGYKVSYRRILEVQARLLARHFLGELAAYPNFVTR